MKRIDLSEIELSNFDPIEFPITKAIAFEKSSRYASNRVNRDRVIRVPLYIYSCSNSTKMARNSNWVSISYREVILAFIFSLILNELSQLVFLYLVSGVFPFIFGPSSL